MPKTVKELVGEAVKSALDEQLKPISDRLEKLEQPDGGGSGEGAGNSGTNNDGNNGGTGDGDAGNANTNNDESNKQGGNAADTEGMAEAIKSAIGDALKPVTETLERVEKRTRPGSQQDDGSGDVSPAVKNDAEYDAFGRKIKLED